MTEQLEHTDELEVVTAPDEAVATETANVETVESEGVEQPAPKDAFIPDDELTPEVKKRLNKLTWEKHELERTLKAEMDALKKQLNVAQTGAQVTVNKPALKDFDYDDDKHREALVAWEVDQRLKTIQPQAVNPAETAQQQTFAEWNQKTAAYAAEHGDYAQLGAQMGNAVQSEAMAGYLMASERGPELHHKLLSNFSELNRIQQLPEWQQGAELAKLETKLTKVKTKQKSNAPDPVRPVATATKPSSSGGGSSPFPTNW